MKNVTKWIQWFLCLAAFLVARTIADAQYVYSTNGSLFDYSISNGSITLTQCSSPPREAVDIPSGINGLPVIAIGPNLFGNDPESSASSITIPDSITNIAGYAFSGCVDLTNIMIGSGVTAMGLNAFEGCSSLEAISVDPLNSAFSEVAGILFDKSQTTLVQFPEAVTGSYAIPDAVTNIGPYAFYGSSLTSLTIGGGVASIGVGAFYYCGALKTILVNSANQNFRFTGGALFGENQTELIVFLPAQNAGSYEIPNSVTSIGDGAFLFCSTLTNVMIPNGVASIGSMAFYDCSSLHGLEIPGGVTNIGDHAFWNCDDLTSVAIPQGVKYIGDDAFYECSALTNVMIENGVASIGNSTFAFCSHLSSVTMPSSVTSIGAYGFNSCYGLRTIYFQGNAPMVGSYAFYSDDTTAYYLPGTFGWTNPFSGLPTALWLQPNPVILNFEPSFGVQSNGFGFPISWATNTSVVVDACTNLTNPNWSPVVTNTLSGGATYFTDSLWTNFPSRFYRVSSQ